MVEMQISNNQTNLILDTFQEIILAISPIKLIIPIYQDVPVITVKVTNHWKKLLPNVVILKDVVVLLGVVGVLPKEMIWSTSDFN